MSVAPTGCNKAFQSVREVSYKEQLESMPLNSMSVQCVSGQIYCGL